MIYMLQGEKRIALSLVYDMINIVMQKCNAFEKPEFTVEFVVNDKVVSTFENVRFFEVV